LSSIDASGFGHQTEIGGRPALRYVGSITGGLKEAAMSENHPAADRLGSPRRRAIKAQVRP
jgi:hypothetical protein